MTDKPASRETKDRALCGTEIGLLAEAFRKRSRARRRLRLLAETSRERPEAMQRSGWARTGLVMSLWLSL